MSRVVLLGPQQDRPTVAVTLRSLGVEGRIATITAGWQEWEADDAELSEELGGRGVNLRLYERAERVWAADPELVAGHREVQDRLKFLRRLYNRQIAHLADNWMDLLADRGPAELVEPQRHHALSLIRSLDAHQLARTTELRTAFERAFRPLERPAVAREREEIARTMRDCEAVVIAGGHVALLHNRLRLFELTELLSELPVIACSGGAMVLGERIALFHDFPPSGPGNTEVALAGLGLFRGLVPFPHARTRLRLDDPLRVARLAERFAPDRCVAFEAGTRVDWDGVDWTPVTAEVMDGDGNLRPWKVAA